VKNGEPSEAGIGSLTHAIQSLLQSVSRHLKELMVIDFKNIRLNQAIDQLLAMNFLK
jgi:hypothetical protein